MDNQQPIISGTLELKRKTFYSTRYGEIYQAGIFQYYKDKGSSNVRGTYQLKYFKIHTEQKEGKFYILLEEKKRKNSDVSNAKNNNSSVVDNKDDTCIKIKFKKQDVYEKWLSTFQEFAKGKQNAYQVIQENKIQSQHQQQSQSSRQKLASESSLGGTTQSQSVQQSYQDIQFNQSQQQQIQHERKLQEIEENIQKIQEENLKIQEKIEKGEDIDLDLEQMDKQIDEIQQLDQQVHQIQNDYEQTQGQIDNNNQKKEELNVVNQRLLQESLKDQEMLKNKTQQILTLKKPKKTPYQIQNLKREKELSYINENNLWEFCDQTFVQSKNISEEKEKELLKQSNLFLNKYYISTRFTLSDIIDGICLKIQRKQISKFGKFMTMLENVLYMAVQFLWWLGFAYILYVLYHFEYMLIQLLGIIFVLGAIYVFIPVSLKMHKFQEQKIEPWLEKAQQRQNLIKEAPNPEKKQQQPDEIVRVGDQYRVYCKKTYDLNLIEILYALTNVQNRSDLNSGVKNVDNVYSKDFYTYFTRNFEKSNFYFQGYIMSRQYVLKREIKNKEGDIKEKYFQIVEEDKNEKLEWEIQRVYRVWIEGQNYTEVEFFSSGEWKKQQQKQQQVQQFEFFEKAIRAQVVNNPLVLAKVDRYIRKEKSDVFSGINQIQQQIYQQLQEKERAVRNQQLIEKFRNYENNCLEMTNKSNNENVINVDTQVIQDAANVINNTAKTIQRVDTALNVANKANKISKVAKFLTK